MRCMCKTRQRVSFILLAFLLLTLGFSGTFCSSSAMAAQTLTWDSTTKTLTMTGDTTGADIRAATTQYKDEMRHFVFAENPHNPGKGFAVTTSPSIASSTPLGPIEGLFCDCSALESVAGPVTFNQFDLAAGLANTFKGCSSLTSISSLAQWNCALNEGTEIQIRDLDGMFSGCTSLEDISLLSTWATKMDGVYSVKDMFENCVKLSDISPLASWSGHLELLQNLLYVFSGCSSLSDLSALSGWKSEKNFVQMTGAFSGCTALKTIEPLRAWGPYTQNTVFITGLLQGCSALEDVTALEDWDFTSLTSMDSLFEGDSKIPQEQFSFMAKIDVEKMTVLTSIFEGCTQLTDISFMANWNVSNVTTAASLFKDCSSLQSLTPLKNWRFTSGIVVFSGTFAGCSSLTSLEGIEGWVPKASSMLLIGTFANCTSLVDSSALGFWTPASNVTSTSDLFLDCNMLQVVDLSFIPLSSVILQSNMFKGEGGFLPSLCSIVFTKGQIPSNFPGSEELDSYFDYNLAWYIKEDGYQTKLTSYDEFKAYQNSIPEGEKRTYVARKAITFDAGEGKFESGFSKESHIYLLGDQVVFPEDASLEGSELVGWASDTGELLVPGAELSCKDASSQYSAVWKKDAGWSWSPEGWRFVNDNGEYVTNAWIFVGDSWYYCNSDAYISQNCWQWIDNAWYGFWDSGAMCKNWIWDNTYQAWFYCGDSGAMVHGTWSWIDGEWYGFWYNGSMCKGWIWDTDWNAWFYCFNSGIMAKDTYIENWWVNSSGVWVH